MIKYAAILALVASPALAGFKTIETDKSVADAMDALETAVGDAGATVFARVDHAKGAASVNGELADAEVLIFGNPKLGTPAIQDDIRAGLALPLRVLIYDDEGQTRIVYEEVEELFDDLDIDDDAEYFSKMEDALKMLTEKAAN